MKKSVLLTSLFLSSQFLSNQAFAEQPSFNYGGISYTQFSEDADEEDVDGDGYEIDFSIEINKNWHAIASFKNSALDDESFEDLFEDDDFRFSFSTSEKTDISELSIGIGYRFDVSDNSLIAFDLSYYQIKVDVSVNGEFNVVDNGELIDSGSFSESEDESFNGFQSKVFYNHQFTESFRGAVGFKYTNIEIEDQSADESNVFVDLDYRIYNNLSASIGVEVGDRDVYSLGVRYFF